MFPSQTLSPKRLRTATFVIALLTGVTISAGPKAEQFPRFDGSIIPIQLPYRPEYRPCHATMTMKGELTMKIGSDKMDTTLSSTIDQDVRRSGQDLEWSAEIREMNVFGQRLRSRTPLMTARWITNAGGDVNGFEVAYPGMKELGMTDVPEPPKIGTTEYVAILKQFGVNSSLPKEPIITGSVLLKQRISDLTGELPGLNKDDLTQDVVSVVKGWAYYNDRKVLVTEETFDVPIKLENAEHTSVTASGYTLYDAATFARVKSEMLMIITGRSEGKDIFFRIHANAESKIQER
jgi:hypothetical protein